MNKSIWRRIRELFPEVHTSPPRKRIKNPSFARRLLNRAGIYYRYDRTLRVHVLPTFFVILGAGFVLLLVGMGGMVKYSESPNFCKSCHIMQPYYDAWGLSKHKDVACVQCHYPPASAKIMVWKKFQALSQVAKFVTRTYSSKPYAEVDDASCLRSGCHSKRLLEGKIATDRGIRFDHRPHLTEVRRGRQLRCVSCQSQMVMGKHVEVTYDTCYLCHFKGRGTGRDMKPLGGCLGCHILPPQNFKIGDMKYNHKDFVTQRNVACNNCHVDVLVGEGEAKQDRCFTCHNEPDKLARYKDISFIHDNHVTKHNVACFHCHQEMRHGFVEDDGSRLAKLGEHKTVVSTRTPSGHMAVLKFDCAYCHTDKHAGQIEMYSGKASLLGHPDMPSPMFLADVDCVACHYQESAGPGESAFGGMDFKASEQACVKCHGPSFTGIWGETRSELNKTLDIMHGKLKAADAALAKSSSTGTERRELEAVLARATRDYRFVKISKGEHNIYLASDILRRADAALTGAGKTLGVDLPGLSELPLISGSYCATMCHTKTGVKVPPETVKVNGRRMPHGAHAGMMGCVSCHEIGAHKKVPPRKGRQALCKTCHEQ